MKNKLNSMRQIKYISIMLLPIFLFSCQDVLDKQDLTTLDERIWEDETQIELYINNLYNSNMPGASFGANSTNCDESYSSSGIELLYGFTSESDIGAENEFHKDNYRLIRLINIGLEGIESSPIDENLKAPLRGQALFLRALRYWRLVRLYGGVPIIKEVQDPFEGSEALDVPRSKTTVSIDEIIADLDEAIADLPVEWTQTDDKGRITSGAAAAFKGRILLAWASPMFNPNNDQSRWQRAYDANKQAIDLLAQMSVPRALYPDFATIFTTNVLDNPEAIIFKRYSLSAGSSYTHGWEGDVRPYSGGGSGSFSPTLQLVNAFPMANGKSISDPESGYSETKFWENRDPRFYATVAYHGSEWFMSGRDITVVFAHRNSTEGNRTPATGFYNKKATNPDITRTDINQTSTAWIELRYAEVLLNFAECANELGIQNEALENVRAIRARAGIEQGDGSYGIPSSVSKEELREYIMIERQIEFAFENKRYWDMRRRLMFREDLGNKVTKLNGTQRQGLLYRLKYPWSSTIRDKESPYYQMYHFDTAYQFGHVDPLDPADINKYWTISIRNLDTYNGQNVVIDYRELYDFFGVPQSIITKSIAVEQTLGWINGTFDPLAE